MAQMPNTGGDQGGDYGGLPEVYEKWVEVPLPNGQTKKIKKVYNSKAVYDDGTRPSTRPYKTTMCCNHPNCEYGDSCTFAHNQEELEKYQAAYKRLLEHIFMTKETVMEHPEMCKNQLCPFRLRLLLKKTIFCQYYADGECRKTIETCTYAHGDDDRKPLPKREMCLRMLGNRCNLKNTECVYAHSEDELMAENVHEQKGLCQSCQSLMEELPKDMWSRLSGCPF